MRPSALLFGISLVALAGCSLPNGDDDLANPQGLPLPSSTATTSSSTSTSHRPWIRDNDLPACPGHEEEAAERYSGTVQVAAEESWAAQHPDVTRLAPGESAYPVMEVKFIRAVPAGNYSLAWSTGYESSPFRVEGPAIMRLEQACQVVLLEANITAFELAPGEENLAGGIHVVVDWGWGDRSPYSWELRSPQFALRS